MFRVKRVTVNLHLRDDIHTAIIYIYMKHPPFNSLVWGSLRLAPTIFALSTALYLFYLYCIYSSIIHRIILMSVVFSVKLPVELEFQYWGWDKVLAK